MIQKKMNLFGILLSLFLLAGCAVQDAEDQVKVKAVTDNDKLLHATLYHQTSAEVDALSLQAFNWAKRVIQDDMRRMGLSKRQAVIVDIDETVLDNSPYEAESILKNTSYPHGWKEWCDQANAVPLPGAVEFLKYAADNGYVVFYITNRKERMRTSTLENLKKFDFPFADNEHLLMRSDEKSKVSRRDIVAENYRIVLLMGDNLADFSGVFDNKSTNEREALVDSLKQEFGLRYIILPNAMYGSWLDAMHDHDFSLEADEIERIQRDKLKGFSE